MWYGDVLINLNASHINALSGSAQELLVKVRIFGCFVSMPSLTNRWEGLLGQLENPKLAAAASLFLIVGGPKCSWKGLLLLPWTLSPYHILFFFFFYFWFFDQQQNEDFITRKNTAERTRSPPRKNNKRNKRSQLQNQRITDYPAIIGNNKEWSSSKNGEETEAQKETKYRTRSQSSSMSYHPRF